MEKDNRVEMTREDFQHLFELALEAAAKNAETNLGFAIPRVFEIELLDPNFRGEIVDPELAVESLYLGPQTAYQVIDVAVKAVRQNVTTVWVRVSGHPPASYEQSWQDKITGIRLFKQVLAGQIRVSFDH